MSKDYLRTCIMFGNDIYIDTSMIDYQDLAYAVYKDIKNILEINEELTDDVYSYDGERFAGNIPAILLRAREHTMKIENVDILSDIVVNTVEEFDEDISWGLTYNMLVDKTYKHITESVKNTGEIFGYTFIPKN